MLASCSVAPVLHSEEPLPQETPAPDVIIPEAPERAMPEIAGAVEMAQQEVRDPFASPSASEEASTTTPNSVVEMRAPDIKVELQGIGFGSQNAYAVIGGEVFYEGDEKNGIKLLEVRRGEVDILMSGGKVTVPLFPGDDLQKSKDRAQEKSAVGVSSEGQGLTGSEFSPQKEQVPS